MLIRLNQIFGVKSRLLLSGLLCLLLVAALAACQPKQAPAPENAADSGQQAPQAVSDKDPLTDPDYAKTVMMQSPEFTEAELVKIYQDMEPVSRGSMSEVVHYLSAEKGWEASRVYYILNKVSSAEMILQDPASRELVVQDWPEEVPTAKELALVEKHRATLHKLIGATE